MFETTKQIVTNQKNFFCVVKQPKQIEFRLFSIQAENNFFVCFDNPLFKTLTTPLPWDVIM